MDTTVYHYYKITTSGLLGGDEYLFVHTERWDRKELQALITLANAHPRKFEYFTELMHRAGFREIEFCETI